MGTDLIIGLGILRLLHLYIAYKEEKLYITPALATARFGSVWSWTKFCILHLFDRERIWVCRQVDNAPPRSSRMSIAKSSPAGMKSLHWGAVA